MSTRLSGMRRTSGRRPIFTLDSVIETALSQELDRFTLNSVASELGVSAPSLYRVIASRDELVDRCLAQVSARFPDPARAATQPQDGLDDQDGPDGHEAPGWRAILERYADDFWTVLCAVPGLAATIINTPGAHAHAQDYIRKLAAALVAADFPGTGDDIEFMLDFIGDITLGTHLMTEQMRQVDAQGRRGVDRAAAALQPADGDPDATVFMRPNDTWIERGNLDVKIRFLLDAVEAGLHPHAHR